MKKVLVFVVAYFAICAIAYVNRSNDYIGKWEVVKVLPKSASFPANIFTKIMAYAKYEDLKSSVYLENSSFEMYFDGRRLFNVPVKYRKIDHRICFGSIEPDKCLYKNKSGSVILSMPTADIVLKRDQIYYLEPGFALSLL